MRIVQVEDHVHADAGYQINIISKYFVEFGHEVIIVTAEMDKMPEELTSFFGKDNVRESDEKYEKNYGVKIIRVPMIKYISGRAWFDRSIFSVVDKLKPDVLFVHGNDSLIGMQYLLKVKKLKYPLVCDSHMLEMASVNKFNKIFRKIYRTFWTPIIVKNKIPVIRTQDDTYVERCLGIPLELCPWISYGSDVMIFHPDKNEKSSFRNEYGIESNDFVAVFAGKLVESKGAMLLAETFSRKFNSKKNVVLLVVGNTEGEYGDKVEEVFSKSENRIIRFPTQKYVDLYKFYMAADIAVFAKQCSLSFYDVQACGLPVVSEANNINVDRCSHNNGKCFEPGNVEDFRRKIEEYINMEDEEFFNVSRNSLEFIEKEYNYRDKAAEYLKILIKAKEDFVNKC